MDRESIGPGRRCALALVGVEPWQAERGSTVVRGEAWRPVNRLGVALRVSAQAARGVEHGGRVRIFLGTGEVMARVLLPEVRELGPGDAEWAVLECEKPLVARVRDRFVVRFYSPVLTIGGGRVAELEPPRRWRSRTVLWERCLGDDPAGAMGAVVELAAGQGVHDLELPLATGLPLLASVEEEPAASSSVRRISDRWYTHAVCARARKDILAMLRDAHRKAPRASGESLESLRAGLGRRYRGDLIDAMLVQLAESGEILVHGPRLRIPTHQPTLTDAEERALRSLLAALRDAGLEVPSPERLAERLGIDRGLLNDLLRLLAERGSVVAITPEMFLAAEVEEEMRSRAVEVLERTGTAGPAAFREALGTSRKYLIPFLEYLDRIGLTHRRREGRILTEGAATGSVRARAGSGEAGINPRSRGSARSGRRS
jgi:selenocysteine-specific elongation factor